MQKKHDEITAISRGRTPTPASFCPSDHWTEDKSLKKANRGPHEFAGLSPEPQNELGLCQQDLCHLLSQWELRQWNKMSFFIETVNNGEYDSVAF